MLYKASDDAYNPGMINGNCESLTARREYDGLIRFVLDISFQTLW